MDLYSHFSQQLQTQPSQRFVLALSGGVDSRVLLALLARYRDEFSASVKAIHVHHGLSANADHWVQQCQRWCEAAAVPLTIERVRLDTTAGESIEQLARQARYSALAKHVQGGEILLLGQHADDQLETFLLALKRGSGPRGLASMAPSATFAQGRLLRPLLAIARRDITEFAALHQLEWVEDESNADVRYERNFLRHRVAPLLTERWPAIRQAVQRSAALCAEQEALLAELLDDSLLRAMQADGSLSITELTHFSAPARRQLIRNWLSRAHVTMPSRLQTDLIWQEVALAAPDANPRLQLDRCQIRRFQQQLYCIASHADVSAWQQPLLPGQTLILPDGLGQLTLRVTGQGNIRLPNDTQGLWISFNPEGLSACPQGRVGSRKLKKLFQEYRVPSWLRRRMPILMHHDQVVAIANLFVDRDFNGQDCELIWDKSGFSMQKSLS